MPIRSPGAARPPRLFAPDAPRRQAFYRSRGFIGDRITTEDVEGVPVEVVELERLIG